MSSTPPTVEVLYNFDYVTEQGETVSMREGEEFRLLDCTNRYWWHVRRNSEARPFYAPASYLKLLPIPILSSPKDENANSLMVEDGFEERKCPQPTFVTFGGPGGNRNSVPVLAFNNPLCSPHSQESLLSTDEDGATTDRSRSLDSLIEDSKYEKAKYANLPLVGGDGSVPPMPTGETGPVRVLPKHWAQYLDSNGRKYYFNSATQELTYKPPRGLTASPDQAIGSQSSSSPLNDDDGPLHKSSSSLDSTETSSDHPLPQGYRWQLDPASGESFISDPTNKKWFFALDPSHHKIYYFDEESNTSLWELPDVSLPLQSKEDEKEEGSMVSSSPRRKISKSMADKIRRSLIIGSPEITTTPSCPEMIWPSLHDGNLVIVKQGPIHRSKLLKDQAKISRQKKGWQPTWMVLTDLFLLFYKESQRQLIPDVRSQRTSSAMVASKPDISIDLNGAIAQWCPDRSSRKNVFMITSLMGQVVLLQDDNSRAAHEWLEAIHHAITCLPNKEHESPQQKSLSCPRIVRGKQSSLRGKPTPSKSEESVVTPIGSNEKRRIRDRLKQFFLKRPSLETLREKGIFKDEPVFGATISQLCAREKTTVPIFVTQCLEAIEEKDLTADGLYRASGNISQIQKIRLSVNQEKYSSLTQEEDVHVLTGALKMFFRSLKEPLFPSQQYSDFLAAAARPDRKDKLAALRKLLSQMPACHRATLAALLNHLLRVCQHSKENRMDVKNLAIVFGPTLLWSTAPCTSDLAHKMMLQSHLVEFLLLEHTNLFPC